MRSTENVLIHENLRSWLRVPSSHLKSPTPPNVWVIWKIFFATRGGAPKEHLLKPTLRLPHRTNARQLDAPVCGTHGRTLLRLGIRVTAGGEERRAFEACKR